MTKWLGVTGIVCGLIMAIIAAIQGNGMGGIFNQQTFVGYREVK